MKKKITTLITIFVFTIALLLLSVTLSACNFDLFLQYQHQEGVTILLMDNSDNFRTQFHFLVPIDDNVQPVRLNEIDAFFYGIIETNFVGDVRNMGRSEPAPSLLGQPAQQKRRILFVYELTRARDDNELRYRFDSNLVEALGVEDDSRAFFMTRTTRHTNPFIGIDFEDELYNNPISPFYGQARTDIAFNVLVQLLRNRAEINGGERVAYNVVFYAEFRGTAGGLGTDVMEVSFRTMIAWHWFLLAGGIAALVVLLILLIAKKGSGRVAKVQKVVVNRFGQIVTIDAAGMPVNEGEVFEELGKNTAQDKDVFDGF